jgi:hypothetical protein
MGSAQFGPVTITSLASPLLVYQDRSEPECFAGCRPVGAIHVEP